MTGAPGDAVRVATEDPRSATPLRDALGIVVAAALPAVAIGAVVLGVMPAVRPKASDASHVAAALAMFLWTLANGVAVALPRLAAPGRRRLLIVAGAILAAASPAALVAVENVRAWDGLGDAIRRTFADVSSPARWRLLAVLVAMGLVRFGVWSLIVHERDDDARARFRRRATNTGLAVFGIAFVAMRAAKEVGGILPGLSVVTFLVMAVVLDGALFAASRGLTKGFFPSAARPRIDGDDPS